MISLDSRILEPSILVRPNIGSVPRNQSKSCSLASFLWGILVSPIFGQTHRSMQHFLNPAGPAEPAAPEDAADDFYEADTASLRSLVSPLFPLCVSLGGFSALRCSKFIPRWNYTTLNIGSIHFGGSYEDGIGDRALHHALGPRWRSVPSIWHPFGKMGYLVIGWSMYWLTYPFSGWISHWYLYFSSFMVWLAIFRKWYRYFC